MLPMPFANPTTYPGHSGIDYPIARGVPFRASGPGVVRTLGSNRRGGYYIWVKYDGYPAVGYHHMDSHNGCPRVGTRVKTGDILGYVGNTGNSTGPHLHSEVEGRATTTGYWTVFNRNSVIGDTPVSPPLTAKETDMIEKLIAINGKVYGVGWGLIKHIRGEVQLNDLRNIRPELKTVELTDHRRGDAWANYLDANAIDPAAIDRNGFILDPFTDTYAQGNAWSEERATRAELRKLASRVK